MIQGTSRPNDGLKRLFDVWEAASYLGLSHWALRKRISFGEIPIVRIGRRVLIDRYDLEQLILDNKVSYGS